MKFAVVISLLIIFSASLIAGQRRRATPLQLHYPENFGNRVFIPADNPMTVEGVELGRKLFYDTRLSSTNQVSCASCHRQELAFTDGRRFSGGIDSFSTERNAMSLVNLLWVRRLFWDGRSDGLERQAEVPLSHPHEMGQSMATAVAKLQASSMYPRLFDSAFGTQQISGDLVSKALAQFERTLISANSRYDQYLAGTYKPSASELNGATLFFADPLPARKIRGAACGQCHGGAKTFSELFHNNGLDSVATDRGREVVTGQSIDRGRFRVVTLRNIALTGPYMHDGRFRTLPEVIDHYADHVMESANLSVVLRNNSNEAGAKQLRLTKAEKQDLLAFLNMLTDSTFIRDQRFSNPFVQK